MSPCGAANVYSILSSLPRMAHATRSEYVLDDTPTIKALRRECHCAAYNLLAAVISCTQIKMDFYNVFLFKEDMSKVRVC